MICDVCKEKTANVYLTQIVEGQMQKVNLCDTCSKEKGVSDPTGFALADLLTGIGTEKKLERAGEEIARGKVGGDHFSAAARADSLS